MPSRAPKACTYAGCGAKTNGGYCEAHRLQTQKHRDQRRESAARRGYGGRWQKARIGFLAKHPLCAHCEKNNRTTAGNVVDHIVPHRGDQKLFWSRDNWQTLCTSCHNTKTATEDGGFGRPQGRGV